jgi:hypothetical protein
MGPAKVYFLTILVISAGGAKLPWIASISIVPK